MHDANQLTAPFPITNAYGLFRRMTGVDGRDEVVIEGTMENRSNAWREFNFPYKPGNVSVAPRSTSACSKHHSCKRV